MTKTCEGADLVVYTDAISKDNVELNQALENNIPTVDRATFLGALMKIMKTPLQYLEPMENDYNWYDSHHIKPVPFKTNNPPRRSVR